MCKIGKIEFCRIVSWSACLEAFVEGGQGQARAEEVVVGQQLLLQVSVGRKSGRKSVWNRFRETVSAELYGQQLKW
jgi:hypothetical protein